MGCGGCGGKNGSAKKKTKASESPSLPKTEFALVIGFTGEMIIDGANYGYVYPGCLVQLPLEYWEDGWPRDSRLAPYNKSTVTMAQRLGI